jgi:cation transport protein ChaC
MALTPELVARCFRTEPDPGPNTEFTPVTKAEQAALADRLLAARPMDPVWVFAYGSLIWSPGFEIAEHRRGIAHGWHRSFCLELTRWRGTPELPGLMMALARGGRCTGLLLRLPSAERQDIVHRLVRREITMREDLGMHAGITDRARTTFTRRSRSWRSMASGTPTCGASSNWSLPRSRNGTGALCRASRSATGVQVPRWSQHGP